MSARKPAAPVALSEGHAIAAAINRLAVAMERLVDMADEQIGRDREADAAREASEASAKAAA